MKFNINNYKKILELFKKNDYDFISAYDWDKFKNKNKKVILRHDIDFETTYAYEIGLLEKKNKVTSNFFFILRDDFYDLYSNQTVFHINKLQEMGHNIGIHLNLKTYKNHKIFKQKIKQDINFFLDFYNIKKLIISYHQPRFNNFKDIKINCEFDAYDYQLMKFFSYSSDSSMKLNFEQLKLQIEKKNNIQFLSHPIWWVTKSNNLIKKINQSKKYKIKRLQTIYSQYRDLVKKIK